MNKQILRLAIPNIISNVSVPLLGAVDLAMMGRLNDLRFMGAIALGSMIFNFIYWSLGFLRMGTCGFTAQAYGAGLMKESVLSLTRALMIALVGAALLLIFKTPIIELALRWIDGEADVKSITASYFHIRIWAAPATIAYFAFSGWFIGMQNTKIPMWIAIFVNVFNVIYNYIFVFIYDMKADGVALGTLLAQYTGLVLSIACVYFIYRKKLPRIPWKEARNLYAMRRFLQLNSHIFLRTLLIISVFSFFTAESSHYGNNILVLNTVLYQFFIFYAYAMDGFAHAAEALSGRFIGARDTKSFTLSIHKVFYWGLGTALLFVFAYGFAYESLLSLFTTQAEIVAMASPYLVWILAITLLSFPAFLWDGIYSGALATKAMFWTMAFSVLLCFFPVYYLTAPYIGNAALWLAMLTFLIARGLSMSLYAKKYILGRMNQ